MATLHDDGTIYVKGAAEVLLDRCSGALDANGQVTDCSSTVFRQALESLASQGLPRVGFRSTIETGCSAAQL